MNTDSIKSLLLSKQDKEVLQSLVDIGVRLAKKSSTSVSIFIILFLVIIYFTSTTKVFIQISVISLFSSILGLISIFNRYYRIYLDLKSGTKVRYTLPQYEIIRRKKTIVLKSKELKLDLSHYDDIVSYVNLTHPLIIEITKRSKTLLFISHNENNLLE